MKTIIVCTDFSSEAENAVQYAASLAQENKYRLILFYLQQISVHALNAQVSADYFYEQTVKNQNKMIAKAAELYSQYSIESGYYLASGSFFEELENCIRDHSGDLVIMGMKEKTFEQKLLGDIATRAIHKIKKPLLIVPAHIPYTGIKKILFAYDIHKNMTWSAMDDIYRFISRFHAEIEIFNVNDRLEDFTQVMNDIDLNSGYDMEDIKYSFKMIESIEVIKAIEEEIMLTNPDILMMIPYQYSFLESLFHQSKTTRMASENKIPLLSIPLNID